MMASSVSARGIIRGRGVRAGNRGSSTAFCARPGRDGARGHGEPEVGNSVVARWTAHARFGHKREALACVQDWLEDIASGAGAGSRYEMRVVTGAVGALESLIEVELEMPGGLAELQTFFGALPREEQASWSRCGWLFEGRACAVGPPGRRRPVADADSLTTRTPVNICTHTRTNARANNNSGASSRSCPGTRGGRSSSA